MSRGPVAAVQTNWPPAYFRPNARARNLLCECSLWARIGGKKMTMTPSHPVHPPALLATGIAGLDAILQGGLPAHRLCLVQGDPGAGKTTLALQFLLEGRRHGEAGLLVTLS